MDSIKSIFKFILYPVIFISGVLKFIITGSNGKQAFLSFRYLFVLTNGKSNDLASKIISWIRPKYNTVESKGILGHLSNEQVSQVVSDLGTTGYHVFETKLSSNQITQLKQFALETPVSYLEFDKKYITYSKEKVLFNDTNPKSPRFQFENIELINNSVIQDLVFDQSLLRIANSFLKTKPIVDIISMWWSVPFNSKATDRAAQKFHFDMDRFKFMKFFFYLTDVTTHSGPHCYVKGSNKNIPSQVLIDRRIEDAEIAANYPKEDIVELTAPTGSIIAVDTRGFHKGKSLTEDNRLLLQIQFSNSLFGAPYKKIKNSILSDKNIEIKKQKQHSYQIIK